RILYMCYRVRVRATLDLVHGRSPTRGCRGGAARRGLGWGPGGPIAKSRRRERRAPAGAKDGTAGRPSRPTAGILPHVSDAPALLDELLGAPGPSGYEGPASDVWRGAASFATLSSDALGSSVARIGDEGAKPVLAVVGHIDEIGLVITHV